MARRYVEIYEIKFRGIEFEEHRITLRDYFTNKRRNSRDSKK